MKPNAMDQPMELSWNGGICTCTYINQSHKFGWLCFVDGSVFTALDFTGYGFVIEDSGRRFQRAVSDFKKTTVLHIS
ncbi:hypothetical protein JCGZ_19850 [Jatropha curcas]|uniref:Uncharacterized protein n=1 Tax=Jatropha curcas TaxID=180498 RepID=A0A067JT63_JATCU|nr:hypothetical protein JCGZ_19850 [Jatropha curcas]